MKSATLFIWKAPEIIKNSWFNTHLPFGSDFGAFHCAFHFSGGKLQCFSQKALHFSWKAPLFERPLARNCNPMFLTCLWMSVFTVYSFKCENFKKISHLVTCTGMINGRNISLKMYSGAQSTSIWIASPWSCHMTGGRAFLPNFQISLIWAWISMVHEMCSIMHKNRAFQPICITFWFCLLNTIVFRIETKD